MRLKQRSFPFGGKAGMGMVFAAAFALGSGAVCAQQRRDAATTNRFDVVEIEMPPAGQAQPRLRVWQCREPEDMHDVEPFVRRQRFPLTETDDLLDASDRILRERAAARGIERNNEERDPVPSTERAQH